MAALRSGSMAVVLAVACIAVALVPVHAQTRLETRGDQSPAVHAGRDATVNIEGTSQAQLPEIVRAVSEGATAPLARQIEDLRGRLGVTEGAALAMLRGLGQADVPVERLPQALAEAAERHKELLERLRRLDADDPEVTRLRDQARGAVERGDYDGADRLLRDAEAEDRAAARRLREGAERRLLRAAETLAQRAGLAGLRFRYREAARLYQQAADLAPESAWRMKVARLVDAGLVFGLAGDAAGAEALMHRALAVVDRHDGPAHPGYAGLLQMLMIPAMLRGQHAEAEALARRALDLAQRQPGNPQAALLLAQIADFMQKTGRHAEAEPLAERALDLLRREPDSPVVALGLMQLATALRNAGRDAEAEALLRRALPGLRGVRTEGHSQFQAMAPLGQAALALLLARTGREQEGEALLREAVEAATAALGPEHHLTDTLVYALGGLLSDVGRHGEAEPLLRRALAGLEAALGPGSEPALSARVALGTLLMATGRAAEGEPMVQAALAARMGNPASSPSIEFRLEYGEALAKTGRGREAEPLLRAAFADAERLYGPRHPVTTRLGRGVAGLSGQAYGAPDAAVSDRATPRAEAGKAPAAGIGLQQEPASAAGAAGAATTPRSRDERSPAATEP